MTTQTAPRPAAVAAVLAQAHTWTSARRKSDGKPFFFIQGSTPGAVYMTAVDGCTCPAAQKSKTGDCKHQEAVHQHSVIAIPAPQQVAAPAPRPTYESLFPACKGGCGDVADTRDGLCDRCASNREWQARQQTGGVDLFHLNPRASAGPAFLRSHP